MNNTILLFTYLLTFSFSAPIQYFDHFSSLDTGIEFFEEFNDSTSISNVILECNQDSTLSFGFSITNNFDSLTIDSVALFNGIDSTIIGGIGIEVMPMTTSDSIGFNFEFLNFEGDSTCFLINLYGQDSVLCVFEECVSVPSCCQDSTITDCNLVEVNFVGQRGDLTYAFSVSDSISEGTWNAKIGDTTSIEIGSGRTVNFTFDQEGTYDVCYVFSGEDGCPIQCCERVCVENPFECGIIDTTLTDSIIVLQIADTIGFNVIRWVDNSSGEVLGDSLQLSIDANSIDSCGIISVIVLDNNNQCQRACAIELNCPDCIGTPNPDLVCPQVIDPVCGCDGVQYNNSCEAEKAGVTSFTEGLCCLKEDTDCDLISVSYNNVTGALDYHFVIPDTLPTGFWSVTGPIDTAATIAGFETELFFSFDNPGKYVVCFEYLDAENCTNRCCVTLDVKDPYSCNQIDTTVVGDLVELVYTDTANTIIIEWKDDVSENIIGTSNPAVIDRPRPGSCRNISVLVKDTVNQCLSICSIQVCEAMEDGGCVKENFNCQPLNFSYQGMNGVLEFNFNILENSTPPLTWTAQQTNTDSLIQLGEGYSVNYTFDEADQYKVCYEYMDQNGCINRCCYIICIDDPYACDLITYTQQDSNYIISLPGVDWGNIMFWMDDATNTNLGSDSVLVIPVPKDDDCRYISAYTCDAYNMCLHICSIAICDCTNPVNVVQNGDFEMGSAGFTSSLDSACICQPGTYCITDIATNKCDSSGWLAIRSLTNDNFLAVESAVSDSLSPVIWSQSVSVVGGETYDFAFDYHPNLTGSQLLPALEVKVDSTVLLSNIRGQIGTWTTIEGSWTAPADGTIMLEIILATNMGGSDFGIDNIEFGFCNTCVEEKEEECALITSEVSSQGDSLSGTFIIPGDIPDGRWTVQGGPFNVPLEIGTSDTIMYDFPEGDTYEICYEYLEVDGCRFFCCTQVCFPPMAIITADTNVVCAGGDLSLIGGGGDNYTWLDTTGTLEVVNINKAIVSPDSTTTYFLVASNACGNDTTSFEVQVLAFEASAGPDTTIVAGTELQLAASGGDSYRWLESAFPVSNDSISNPTTMPTDTTFYVVEISNNLGCSLIDTVIVNVMDSTQAFAAVANYNVITPNNDGMNDFLEFDDLERYPENELTIFNRWGGVVYEKKGYQQDGERWDGTMNQNPLPEGVYFYILRYEGKQIRQAITIMREQ